MSGVETTDNPCWATASPRLSVLIPFFRDDPGALLAALGGESVTLRGAVEVVVLDDVGGDAALSTRTAAAVEALPLPARLIRLAVNEGRSRGRNRLAASARGRHFLFVDSDMLPDRPDFLARWLKLATEDAPAAVGGFSLDQAAPGPEHALHCALQLRGECAPAAVRALKPEKYVFTSNLLVRRDVFETEAFDEGFSGWGWEDVEWGMRVAARYGVIHIDNSATHLGLDTADALATKYEQSAGNFARMLVRHPEVVKVYPSYRVARLIRRLPARGAIRKVLLRLALDTRAPLTARVAAMKAYRAAIYAEVVG